MAPRDSAANGELSGTAGTEFSGLPKVSSSPPGADNGGWKLPVSPAFGISGSQGIPGEQAHFGCTGGKNVGMLRAPRLRATPHGLQALSTGFGPVKFRL